MELLSFVLRPEPSIKFETAAFSMKILRVRMGLSSKLIRHENGAFLKRSSNRRNLTTPALQSRVDKNIFKTELFDNHGVTVIM